MNDLVERLRWLSGGDLPGPPSELAGSMAMREAADELKLLREVIARSRSMAMREAADELKLLREVIARSRAAMEELDRATRARGQRVAE